MTAAMFEPTRRTPAEELRRARKNARLEQAELASLIGVSTKSISRWENGHGEPTISQWRRIASVTEQAWLLAGGDHLVTQSDAWAVVENQQERLPMHLPAATHTPILAAVK